MSEEKNKTFEERLSAACVVESPFDVLFSVDVSGHTEKKPRKSKKTGRVINLTFLSWAWAWAEVKSRFPDANYKIYENADGLFYHTDGRTAWVKTSVTIDGIEHVDYLPVMDEYNGSIPLERITSFDVNRAIQRSITKACARHGLGLKIYAGEDLPPDKPETVDVPKINRVTPEQVAQLEKELQRTGARWNPATVKADLDVKTWEHYMNVLRAKPDKEAEA
jgi:hypothetical protein